MQAYLTFIDKVDGLIEKANAETLSRVGFEICKRLLPDFKTYADRNLADFTIMEHALEVFERTPAEIPDNLIEEISKLTPETSEISGLETLCATNACQAVSELLKYARDKNPRHISEICSLAIDTTDFKIADANQHLSDDGIFKHPQMTGTMTWILEMLK